MPYRFNEIRALETMLGPVQYSIRNNEHTPEFFVGAHAEVPAMADQTVRTVAGVMRNGGYAYNDPESFAESLCNRYIGLNGEGAAVLLQGWANPCVLRVRVVLDDVDQNGFPLTTGDIAAWVNEDGSPYLGRDPEADGAQVGWLPFAFG